MRTLLALLTVFATVSTAAADDGFSTMMPGVRSNGSKPGAYMGVMLGHLKSELLDDNLNRGPSENSGWLYGINFRGEALSLVSAYGGTFGMTLDLEMFLATPGTVEGPMEPKASWVHMSMAPALALGLVKYGRSSVSAELGAVVNTDFYGLTAGVVVGLKWLYISYKFRSGESWHKTQVLDERVRVGVSGRDVGSFVSRMFVGLEVTDGYSEDDRGRAELRTMFRGSYTMVAFIISVGK